MLAHTHTDAGDEPDPYQANCVDTQSRRQGLEEKKKKKKHWWKSDHLWALTGASLPLLQRLVSLHPLIIFTSLIHAPN